MRAGLGRRAIRVARRVADDHGSGMIARTFVFICRASVYIGRET
jgi:hypothetical protein